MEFGRVFNFTIKIEPTHNRGFTVRVGCGRFAFTNIADLKLAFLEWCDNPEKLENEYNKMGLSTNEAPTDTAEDIEVPDPQPRPRGRLVEAETAGDPA